MVDLMMKPTLLLALGLAMGLVSADTAAAPQQKTRATGLFSDMRWIAEAGDVVGTEVFIMYSTDGLAGDYWALVQIAVGVPGPPALVRATVAGDLIEFTLPEAMGGRFVGRVTSKGLTGKFERFTDRLTLPRRKSYWQ